MISIDDLYNFIVKINDGSGLLLPNKNMSKSSFIITAYHCIKNSVIHNEKIEISYEDGKKNQQVKNIFYDEKEDIALIEADSVNNKATGTYKYEKEEDTNSGDKIVFMGYPQRGKGHRKSLDGNIIEWNKTKTSINTVADIHGSFINDEKTNEVIVGFSGSGVFKKNANRLHLIGILKSLPEKDFEYKEITCVSISKILQLINKNKISLIELEPYNKEKNKKVDFIISTLSNRKISGIKEDKITEIYQLIEENESNSSNNIFNILWLIIFYEHSNYHGAPRILVAEKNERQKKVSRCKISNKELGKIAKINICTSGAITLIKYLDKKK